MLRTLSLQNFITSPSRLPTALLVPQDQSLLGLTPEPEPRAISRPKEKATCVYLDSSAIQLFFLLRMVRLMNL